MAIEVFNRYEKKYMMDRKTFELLSKRLEEHMVPDKFNKNGQFYSISNIYYDTVDDRLIRASIEKPVYKEKLRLRAYGVPELDTKVFVEIKKKYDGIVNKRRTTMTLKDAYTYLNENGEIDRSNPILNSQVLKEIDYFKDFYKIVPKVYLSYDRFAFFEKNDGDFRLTFDTNIQTRRDDLRLEHGMYGKKLIPDDVILMETKISGAIPVWFSKIISEFNIYPVSFSKYGTEYKNYVLANYNFANKGEKLCLNQSFQQVVQSPQSVLAAQC